MIFDHASGHRRSAHRRTLSAALTALVMLTPVGASAQTFLSESFTGVPMDAQRVRLSSDIAGTTLKVTNGVVEIRNEDPTGVGHGNFLWMPLGWYQPVNDPLTNIGTASLKSTRTFDLFAGVLYTLKFDWTRQGFSAGNGPFPFSMTARLGSHALVLNDDAGFYYGENWQTATLTFTPETTELGAIMSFDGSGIGYTGLYLDNIEMIGLADAPPTLPGVVPEPTTWALMVTGFGMLALMSRRRPRATR